MERLPTAWIDSTLICLKGGHYVLIQTTDLIDPDNFHFVPDPFRREVDPAAVGAGLDRFLDHLFPEDFYLGLASVDSIGRARVCVSRAIFIAAARRVPMGFITFCHGGRLLTIRSIYMEGAVSIIWQTR